MTKLNQLIAVVPKKKAEVEALKGEVHKKLKVRDLLTGITKTYQPKVEDGDIYPDERKNVQYSVTQAIVDFNGPLSELLDVIYVQEYANTKAKATVKVDNETVLVDVPVTYLLFLEKQLNDLHTFVEGFPVLDPAIEWEADPNTNTFRSKETRTLKTKKVYFNHVKFEGNEHHPPQVDVLTRDDVEGTWNKTDFSGAIPAKEKKEYLDRVTKLREAVIKAREEANLEEIEQFKVGNKILSFVFGG